MSAFDPAIPRRQDAGVSRIARSAASAGAGLDLAGAGELPADGHAGPWTAGLAEAPAGRLDPVPVQAMSAAERLPALEAAAVARAVAARLRASGSPPAGLSLEQVRERQLRTFRPRRRIAGPVPYATSYARVRPSPSTRAGDHTVPPWPGEPGHLRALVPAQAGLAARRPFWRRLFRLLGAG